MDINQALEFLDFWVSKEKGAFFTIAELTMLVENGQTSFYTDVKPKYATSNLVKEILSPFRATYDFNPSNTISGVISVPSDSNYLDLLDLSIRYQISNRVIYYSVPMTNEDVKSSVLNSQINPITVTSPAGEIIAPRFFKLYPEGVGYTGTVTYLRKPVAPVFGYTVISGRRIVYDPTTSVQLEWRETEIIPILLKSLESIGINLSAEDVSTFAAQKTASNYMGINKL